MAISYEGIGQTCVTLRKKNTVTNGCVCAMAENNCVGISEEDENIIGIAAAVKGDYVSLIVSGIVTVPYSGTAPGVGICPLAGDGSGNVKYSTEGINYRVLSIDTKNRTVTFIL